MARRRQSQNNTSKKAHVLAKKTHQSQVSPVALLNLDSRQTHRSLELELEPEPEMEVQLSTIRLSLLDIIKVKVRSTKSTTLQIDSSSSSTLPAVGGDIRTIGRVIQEDDLTKLLAVADSQSMVVILKDKADSKA